MLRLKRFYGLPFAVIMMLIVFSALPVGVQAAGPAHPWNHGPLKVLLEVDGADQASWHTAIAVSKHALHTLGVDNVKLEIIAWGPGVRMMLKSSPYAADVRSLSMYGVRFVVCHTNLKVMHIPLSELEPGVQLVPDFLVEVARRHQEGWLQLKM
ncbi:MAG: DsrE family protein [Gammaproteobacteria bacterium]|nr:DsrE family protein [Gammaproteobacteria bacterium]